MGDSDDEFELVQCEEILISEEEDDPEPKTLECQQENPCSSAKIGNEREPSEDNVSKLVKKVHPLHDKSALKYVRRPTRPVRLFSFTDRDLQKRFSQKDEASKNLALQLLDIVKSVNSQRKVKVENGTMVPNFYIMATKCESKPDQKITVMDSADIVNLVKDIVHMIKIGIYRQVDYVDIICDSPAIFLIKRIMVKHWDSSMNAVYVVTSEYLSPYVCKIKAAEEEEEKAEKRIIRNVIPVNTSSKTGASKRKKSSLTMTSKKVKLKEAEEEPSTAVAVLPNSAQTDEEIVDGILSKYLECDAVQFFVSQMKVAGKTHNQYRWKDDDKLFALNLLRKAPTEYSILFQKFKLPSDKTLEKFVRKVHASK